MPLTPDRNPGPREEEEVILEPNPSPVGGPGTFHYSPGGTYVFEDSVGTFDPRTGGSGITAEQHNALRQLIHFINEGPGDGFASGAEKETAYSGAFVASTIWWSDGTGSKKKIVEKILAGPAISPTTITWKMYDAAETLLITLVDTFTYSGINETLRIRTWS